MKRIVLYGLIAALFFSSTFAINRWLNVEQGGHWYWTATLRYVYVFIFLSIILIISKGYSAYKETIRCFFAYFYFWIIAGGVGFGLFYLFLCYAASFSPGWVLATTWQLTILMTPVIIFFLGYKVSRLALFYLMIMFTGVLLVNIGEFNSLFSINIKSILPILLAAICYPLGNTLCKYACEGKFEKINISHWSISKNTFSQILLMTLGAFPVLLISGLFILPPAPTYTQVYSTAFIALSTGIVATSLLYKARQFAGNDTFALAAADGTQAAEPPLSLFWEVLIFGGILPTLKGVSGLILVICGIFMFYRSNISTPQDKSKEQNDIS